MTRLRHVSPEDIDDTDDEDVPVIYRGCLGYSGCNCWECECHCGLCLRCNPRANHTMSAEQTLLVHWRACVESRDRVCVSAFVDHLMELFSTAVSEDGEYYRETMTETPILRLIHGEYHLTVDHAWPQFDDDGVPINGGNVRFRLFWRGTTRSSTRHICNTTPPSAWAFEEANNFVDALCEFLGEPNTLPERSGTPMTGGLHG